MNRREFFVGTASVGASILILPTLGCPGQSTIATLTNVLGTAAANIANLEGNPGLGAKLTADTAAAVKAINAWKNGTPATMAIEFLNLVMDDLNLFPIASPYIPLIDLAIGTVESILALLPQSPTVMAAHAANQRTVTLNHTPKDAKEFKAQWTSIIHSHPELSAAAIK